MCMKKIRKSDEVTGCCSCSEAQRLRVSHRLPFADKTPRIYWQAAEKSNMPCRAKRSICCFSLKTNKSRVFATRRMTLLRIFQQPA